MAPPTRPKTERFWEKVEKTDGCWLWTAKVNEQGYGVFRLSKTPNRAQYAHRFAYLACVGAVPDGLVLDHTCHNEDKACPGGPTCPHRRCVNPDHLVLATRAQNVQRGRGPRPWNRGKTHCIHGHEFTPENTRIRPDGTRSCRRCAVDSSRRYRLKVAA